MKRYKLYSIVLLVLCLKGNAQTSLSSAFARSYGAEARMNYPEAISALRENYDRSSYEINLRLGWLYYKAAMHKESIAYYRIAASLMPYAIEAKFGCAYPYAAMGNTAELAALYDQILVIDPQNMAALYQRGMIHYNKKEYTVAFKCFEKMANLYPFEHDGLLMYAWTNLRLGKTKEALVLFNKVLLISPSDKSALEGLQLMNNKLN